MNWDKQYMGILATKLSNKAGDVTNNGFVFINQPRWCATSQRGHREGRAKHGQAANVQKCATC